ncbi:MAG TPA: hypothetical protein VMF09_14320 [Solirubrobacteraceae bacterium]|nr:hypothetical protein [Solirubrobacteraceae bacterium]
MASRASGQERELLARVREEIEQRLDALRPAVAEYERLLGAAGALEPRRARDPAAARRPRPAASVAGSVAPPAAPPGGKPRRPPAPASRPAPAPRPARARAQPKPRTASPRAAQAGAAERAIMAALEHGSHTVAELGVVTAMSGAQIRAGARQLLKAGRIVRTSREGRSAYALSGSE